MLAVVASVALIAAVSISPTLAACSPPQQKQNRQCGKVIDNFWTLLHSQGDEVVLPFCRETLKCLQNVDDGCDVEGVSRDDIVGLKFRAIVLCKVGKAEWTEVILSCRRLVNTYTVNVRKFEFSLGSSSDHDVCRNMEELMFTLVDLIDKCPKALLDVNRAVERLRDLRQLHRSTECQQ